MPEHGWTSTPRRVSAASALGPEAAAVPKAQPLALAAAQPAGRNQTPALATNVPESLTLGELVAGAALQCPLPVSSMWAGVWAHSPPTPSHRRSPRQARCR